MVALEALHAMCYAKDSQLPPPGLKDADERALFERAACGDRGARAAICAIRDSRFGPLVLATPPHAATAVSTETSTDLRMPTMESILDLLRDDLGYHVTVFAKEPKKHGNAAWGTILSDPKQTALVFGEVCTLVSDSEYRRSFV